MSGKHHSEENLLAHEYDGIREYDNPTPGWWHMLFLASIVFSVFYFLFFQASSESWTVTDTWQAAKVEESRRLFGKVGDLADDEAAIQAMRANTSLLEVAEAIFVGNCAQCHAKDGGGMDSSGVNLTDESYKNVRRLEDLYNVITRGAGGQAMPAWENRLSQNERVILTAYVANLRGTNPANPKAPEGQPIDPWPPIPAETETK
jgi:cytochrome c oxidase cbb3-type subunit 3